MEYLDKFNIEVALFEKARTNSLADFNKRSLKLSHKEQAYQVKAVQIDETYSLFARQQEAFKQRQTHYEKLLLIKKGEVIGMKEELSRLKAALSQLKHEAQTFIDKQF